jgi:general stress protein YciG
MPERDRSGISNRGFAAMDAQKQRAIARKGGHSVPPGERSFAKDRQLAAQAGRKGGRGVAPENRSFSRDPALAAEAGRKGGEHSRGRHRHGGIPRRRSTSRQRSG